MSSHDFTTGSPTGQFGTVLMCRGCKDPEPDNCEDVWIDSDGTVYFDPAWPQDADAVADALLTFMARHDAFGLTRPGRASRAVRAVA